MTQGHQTQGWFSLNWKWIAGLFAGAMLISCLCVTAVAGIAGIGLLGAVSVIKASPVYQEALQTVQNDSRAQEMLGTPITAGWMITGEISESGPTGTADFSIPVSGPKGSGRVDVVAKKVNGEWTITLLQLVMDDTFERLLIIGEIH
ncbi:MAG: cytochrome c oxidase assembly factor Coa1 family protein [Anaerolineales bacterium]